MQQAAIIARPMSQEMDRTIMQIARHYGFAQVPRAITRGKYKEASLIEKGLYTCLKDICGDAGECFYTLRNLAKEICTSISTLSRYIPKLIQRGLIAATKKPGHNNKHEIYHIAIVNIWSENDALYKPQEIVSDRNKVTDDVTESVADRNNPDNIVADRNNNQEIDEQNATSVSDSNKDCFYLNDRIITSLEEESVTSSESSDDSNISVTHVTDDAPLRPYAEGHPAIQIKRDDLEALTNRLMEDVYREQPAKISTPVIHSVDTESHSHSQETMPTRKEAAPPEEQPPHAVQDQLTDAGNKGSATSPPTRETGKRGNSKKADESPAKCDTKEVHRRINDRRGYGLEERVDVIRENQAIKTWCHLHTIDECDPVLDYLQERDPFWSKPENKHRIGGVAFLKETPRVLALLAKRKNGSPSTSKLGVSGLPRDVPLTDKPLPVILHRNQPKRGYA